jgi:ATP-dependent DNA ligase
MPLQHKYSKNGEIYNINIVRRSEMNIKSFKYFYPEKPVLMNIEQESFAAMSNDPDWVAELKYNGNRCPLWIIDGNVQFWGRHGKLLAYNADPDPEIVAFLKEKFPKGIFLFDSELRHNKVTGVRNKLVIWDVFIFRDRLLNREQYWSRRAILSSRIAPNEKVITSSDKVKLITQYPNHFAALYKTVIKDPEIEGLVLKNQHGILNISRTSGQNSNWMYKVRKASGRYAF